MERIIFNFFTNLFSSSGCNDTEQVCNNIERQLSPYHQAEWSQVFNEEEVKDAIDQMHPLKASGPDGCQLYFSRNIGMWWGMIS